MCAFRFYSVAFIYLLDSYRLHLLFERLQSREMDNAVRNFRFNFFTKIQLIFIIFFKKCGNAVREFNSFKINLMATLELIK